MNHFRFQTILGNGWMVSTANLDAAGHFQLGPPWETAVIPVDKDDPAEPLEVGHHGLRSDAVDFHERMAAKWGATHPDTGRDGAP